MTRTWFRSLFTRPAHKPFQRARLGVEAFEDRLVPSGVDGALGNSLVWLKAEGDAVNAVGTPDGQLIGGPSFATGVSGAAFALDGANDYVRVHYTSPMPYSVGVSADAWINPVSLPQQGVKTGGWEIVNQTTESTESGNHDIFLARLMYDGSVLAAVHTTVGNNWQELRTPAHAVAINTFTHVAVTIDQSTKEFAIYVNGAKTSRTIVGSLVPSIVEDFKVGSDQYNFTYFKGKIDEVGLYNRALTATEISTIVALGGASKSILGAPTADLQTNSGVAYGSDATAALVNPFDSSAADTSAGFHYAFSLGTDTTGSATYATSGTNNAVNFGALNAGTYTVYARIIDQNDMSTAYSTSLIVSPKLLEATAATQGTINIGSNGSIVMHLAVSAGQLYGADTIAGLFNGACFTIQVQKADGSMTYGTLHAEAQVEADGTITVAIRMNDDLRADLYEAYVNGRAVSFNMSATANGGNYFIDEDAMSRLLNNGSLRYVQ